MNKLKLMLGILGVALAFGTVNVKAMTITEDLVLDKDLTEQVIVSEKKVTVNLNGHSIRTASNGALAAINGAVVTVTGEGIIESTNSNGIVVSNGSTVILKSGNIKSTEFGVLVAGNATFTMDGGTITTVDNCGVGGNGRDTDYYKNYTININGGVINGNIKSAGYVSCGIYHPNKGTVNVTGGVINSSNGAGIVQRAGTLNIEGGTINAKGSATGKVGDSRVVVSASAVVVDKEANYPEVGTLVTKVSKDALLDGVAGSIETIGNDINVQLTGGVYTEKPGDDQVVDGYGVYKVVAGENEDKYVVVSDNDLENVVVDDVVNKEDVDSAELELIEKSVLEKYKLLSYYDVALLTVTKTTGDVVDVISDSAEETKVTLKLPSNLPSLESGYTRKYYVIRVHNGEATVIKDVTDNGNGTVSFKTDKFSTYAVAYEDTKTISNPQTGDNIVLNVVMLVLSLSGIAGGLIYYKKNKLVKNN